MNDPTKSIGYDPVTWIERLLDVNSMSAFTQLQKDAINDHLDLLLGALKSMTRD